ncbi:hypothetical protein SDC9_160489 [bioreactor metagenome]|uniref:Uncharacterized protein n=1 Tax=bioreactor metagenome TaxID=1076179 RepID=A0A645FIJ3_9ZZZZ
MARMIRAPTMEPSTASIPEGIAVGQSTHLFLIKRIVDALVPMLLESLFVAIALCGGIPASRYAGSVMSPPPPATASRRLPVNTSGQMINRVQRLPIMRLCARIPCSRGTPPCDPRRTAVCRGRSSSRAAGAAPRAFRFPGSCRRE